MTGALKREHPHGCQQNAEETVTVPKLKNV